MMIDPTREDIIGAGKRWLDGYIEANPYVVIGVVSVLVLATLFFLWRRYR